MNNAFLVYSILATLLILLCSVFVPVALKSIEESERRMQEEKNSAAKES